MTDYSQNHIENSKLNNALRWSFFAFLIVSLLVFYSIGDGKWGFIEKIKLDYLVYAWLLNTLCVSLDFYNWFYLLKKSHPHFFDNLPVFGKLKNNILLSYLGGFALDFLPAKVGTFSRVFYLHKQYQFPRTNGFAVQSAALLIDLSAALMLALVFASMSLSEYLESLTLLTLLLLAGVFFLFIFFNFAHQLIYSRFNHLIKSWLSHSIVKHSLVKTSLVKNSTQVFSHFKALMVVKYIYQPLLVKCFSWILLGVSFYTLITAFGYSVDIKVTILAVAFSALAGGISLLSGGIGTTDLSLFAFCLLMKIPADSAVLIVFCYRMISFWYLLLLGNLSVHYVFASKY